MGQADPLATVEVQEGAQRGGAAVALKLRKPRRHIDADGVAVAATGPFEPGMKVARHGMVLCHP